MLARRPSLEPGALHQITITSECYPTVKEATLANDAIASRIHSYLTTLIDPNNAREQVLATGGYTQKFSRTIQVNNVQVIECKGTFAKTSSLTLKSTRVADFASIFDDMQERVYADLRDASEEGNNPTTYVTIDTPSPALFYDHRAALEEKAIALAVAHAKAKFDAANSDACKITSTDLVGINDFSTPSVSKSEAAFDAPRSAPVSFDSQWVNVDVTVEFQFEGGHCK
jgi:hypothetical protein